MRHPTSPPVERMRHLMKRERARAQDAIIPQGDLDRAALADAALAAVQQRAIQQLSLGCRLHFERVIPSSCWSADWEVGNFDAFRSKHIAEATPPCKCPWLRHGATDGRAMVDVNWSHDTRAKERPSRALACLLIVHRDVCPALCCKFFGGIEAEKRNVSISQLSRGICNTCIGHGKHEWLGCILPRMIAHGRCLRSRVVKLTKIDSHAKVGRNLECGGMHLLPENIRRLAMGNNGHRRYIRLGKLLCVAPCATLRSSQPLILAPT
mmetsp:Transcript_79535/g.170487  ORF Transcript_79535/g.170487 Transcript_79535/m.170487 type:complete len:266 (+) Transcript_79535:1939-2736(+)